MKGILIYDTAQKSKNEWFINRFLEVFNERKIELKLCIVDNFDDFSLENGVDFAIVRTINPKLTKFLEENGVTTFNGFETSFIANDKFRTYLFAKKFDIPVLKTEIFLGENLNFIFPFVVKKRNGHGGAEVYLVNDSLELNSLKNKITKNNESFSDYIIQELATTTGVDTRHYVLGGEIVLSVERSSKTDFRSNFSLGGECKIVEISKEEKNIIDKVYSSLNCHFVGIDIISHKGKKVLNEIEDVVGTRMIYKLTEIDIVSKYANYIIEKLNKI